MEIRPATPSDAARIHEVSRAACVAAYEPVLDDRALIEMVEDPDRVSRVRERLETVADDGSVTYLVAQRDRVLGFAQTLAGERTPGHVDDGDAYLRSLYVHPDHWREGIGSDLLAESCARLPDDTRRVVVGVLSENDLGRGFYEQRGFERVGTGSFEVRGTAYETTIYRWSRASA